MGLDDDKTYIRALEKVFSIYEVIIRRNYDIELRKSLTFLLSRNRNLVSEFWVEEFFSGEKDVDRRKEILKDLYQPNGLLTTSNFFFNSASAFFKISKAVFAWLGLFVR